MLKIQNKNIYNSKTFEKFINKFFKKGKKSKYLKIINLALNNLKKSKFKPKKKIKVTYKPFLLSIKQQYLISIK